VRPAVRTRSAFRRALTPVVLPAAALAAILLLDLVRESRGWPLPVLGVLDEPAHLLTAWLVLAAVTARTTALRFLPWVLAGAVLLDLDHVPLFLGLDVTATQSGRPVTHSLTTVAVLLLAALVVRRWRGALAGLALGAATQLLRDLSTGPGVPLFWPFVAVDVRLPYLSYLLVLVALAVAATARRLRHTGMPPRDGVAA
jgi:inner membrane protein